MTRLLAAARRQGIEAPEVVVVALLMTVGLVDSLTAPADHLGAHPWIVVLGMTMCPVPLLVMRRHATAALLGVAVILLSIHFLAADVKDLFTPMVTLVVGAFAAGAYAQAPRAYWLGALLPVLVGVVDLTSESNQGAEDFIFPTLIFLAAWFVGRLVRGRAQVAERLEAQTAQLERERDELAQAAVARERARIARELHDVVAHSVSAMVVQAGAARRVLPRSPQESAAALEIVQSVGRQALGELRRTLGFLRADAAAPAELRPAPSIARVGELADNARAAGLHVDLRVQGEPGTLPSSTDLAAYRIVQEALTNTLKHAGPAHATVLLRWDPDALVIDVRDTGRGPGGPSPAIPSSGHGLAGMRERATLAGGELEAGPVRGGGFRVHARLPRIPADPADRPHSTTESQEAQPA